METLCWCPFEGHKYGRRTPTKTIVSEYYYKCVNSSLEEHKDSSDIYSETRNVQITKSQKIDSILNPHKSFPLSPAKDRDTQKPGNSRVLYRKTKNLSSRKFHE